MSHTFLCASVTPVIWLASVEPVSQTWLCKRPPPRPRSSSEQPRQTSSPEQQMAILPDSNISICSPESRVTAVLPVPVSSCMCWQKQYRDSDSDSRWAQAIEQRKISQVFSTKCFNANLALRLTLRGCVIHIFVGRCCSSTQHPASASRPDMPSPWAAMRACLMFETKCRVPV